MKCAQYSVCKEAIQYLLYIVTRTIEKETSEGMPRTEPIMAQGGERVWSGGEVGSGMVMDHRGMDGMGWQRMASCGSERGECGVRGMDGSGWMGARMVCVSVYVRETQGWMAN